MAPSKVIVFGPTGKVGSVAARTAHAQGAQVVLAMRDTQKAIPRLSHEDIEAGGYEKVQADLTQPESIIAAVKKTGATSAFIYLVFGAPNGMKTTIETLKTAGITFVVFLSSYTITKPLDQYPQNDIIPDAHAAVETNLEAIYGPDHYVAVRPGGFASNTLNWTKGIKARNVKLQNPEEAQFDYIASIDMGRVSGNVLAQGAQPEGQKIIYLYGPRMTSQGEAVRTIAAVLGEEIQITPLSASEAVEEYKSYHMPEPFAKYMSERMENRYSKIAVASEDKGRYEQGVANIEKFGGKPPTSLREWVQDNKELFV